MKFKIFCFFLFSLAFNTYASDLNLRRCLLLPILDEVDGAIGYKVFEEVERFLMNSDWCYYEGNSEIINILQNYKKNLKKHLSDPKILKLLSEKSKAGSLIKVDLYNATSGIEAEIKVYGESGDDLYYSEKEFVETQNITKVINSLRIHLKRYSKTIPYHARVLGVLGKQITLDMGKLSGIKIGHKFLVKRKTRKVNHPLLNKIITYEMDEIAEGEIVSLSDTQSIGIIKSLNEKKRLKTHDWIIFDFENSKDVFKKGVQFPVVKGHEFGKLGIVEVSFIAGKGENASYAGGINRNIGGLLFGLGGAAEVWATRNYFLKFEIEKSFATYKKELGPVSKDENEIDASIYKVTAGHRFLPLEFFYGPQVDTYLGYAKYSFDIDTVNADGIGSSSFYGPLIGAIGSMPIYHQFRTYLRAELIFKPSYYEDIKIHGAKTGSHSYHFEVGALYDYDVRMQLKVGLSRTSNQAKFGAPDSEIRYKETKFKTGVLFTF